MTTPTVTRTSGGRWDPTSANLTFLAGSVSDHEAAGNTDTLVALNELGAGEDHLAVLDRWCDTEGRRVLLDSGVFALVSAHARTHGLGMGETFALPPSALDGWSALYDRYCQVVSRFADRLWGVMELDLGGAEACAATRASILADTGVTPIPIYHPLSDGWAYFDTLAGTHDRIAVGGLVRLPAPHRLRVCWTAADRARAYPHLWTHLLGVTPSPVTLSLGLRGSMDSSRWLASLRWSADWKARALTQRLGLYPTGMTYRRGDGDSAHPEHGRPKAMRQCAAEVRFLQETVTAVADDTHRRPATIPRPR